MQTSRAAAVLLAALFLPGPALGQDTPPTIIEGYVVDGGTGLPVPNVLIRAHSGLEVVTDDDGRYILEGLPPGDSRLVLVTSRCNVTWGSVTLEPAEIRQVVFQVPPEVSAREADSVAVAREWRSRSTGKVFTASELEDMHAPSVLEVIRREAPGMVGGEGQAGATPTLRSRSMVSGQGLTEPVLVVDDLVVDGAWVLGQIHPSEVALLEISKSAAAGWEYGVQGAGGVIRVKTKQGEEGHWNASPRRCEIPPFPGDGPAGAEAG